MSPLDLSQAAAATDGGPSPGTGWPAQAPLPAALMPVPPFDVDRLLPPALAGWIQDIAERAQCPVDFVAVAAAVAAAAVIGRSITIRPKRQDDWTVVPNLWGVAVGPPGIMKTPALQEALKPLHRLVFEAKLAHERRRAEHEFLAAEAKARKEALRKKLHEAIINDTSTEALRAAFADLPEYHPPTEQRYLVNDATVEKLGMLLNENPNGLLVFRDELVGLVRMMDRQGHENDRAFFCEAWAGSNSYTYDRVGRGTLHIAAACVSLLGGMTPGPLQAYLREVFGAGATHDGFIQRFQLMVYPDPGPPFCTVDRWPNSTANSRPSHCSRRWLDSMTYESERSSYRRTNSRSFASAGRHRAASTPGASSSRHCSAMQMNIRSSLPT